jgi:hypothetical protein
MTNELQKPHNPVPLFREINSPGARRAIWGAISALRSAISTLQLVEEGGDPAAQLAEATKRTTGAVEYICQAQSALSPDA